MSTGAISTAPASAEYYRKLGREENFRFHVFEGGCITVQFTLSGDDRAEPLAVATQIIGTVPREDLQNLVLDDVGDHLAVGAAEKVGRQIGAERRRPTRARCAQYGGSSAHHVPSVLNADQKLVFAPCSSSDSSMSGVTSASIVGVNRCSSPGRSPSRGSVRGNAS